MFQIKDKHSSQLHVLETRCQDLSSQLSDVSSSLHERDVTVTLLQEQSACAERQVRDQEEQAQRRTAELHVSRNAHARVWFYRYTAQSESRIPNFMVVDSCLCVGSERSAGSTATRESTLAAQLVERRRQRRRRRS